MEAGHEAQIIPLNPRPEGNGVERINGIRLHLGSMSLEELQQIEGHTRERVLEAQHDLWVISDYVDRLGAPNDPSAA
jgi:hypothetical protein